MKKLLFVFLIFSFLFSFAFADVPYDNHPDEFVGIWAVFVPTSITFSAGNISVVLVLNSDGTASMMTTTKNFNGEGITMISNSGTWFYTPGYIFTTATDTGEYGAFVYSDDTIWFTGGVVSLGLRKLPVIDLSQIVYQSAN